MLLNVDDEAHVVTELLPVNLCRQSENEIFVLGSRVERVRRDGRNVEALEGRESLARRYDCHGCRCKVNRVDADFVGGVHNQECGVVGINGASGEALHPVRVFETLDVSIVGKLVNKERLGGVWFVRTREDIGQPRGSVVEEGHFCGCHVRKPVVDTEIEIQLIHIRSQQVDFEHSVEDARYDEIGVSKETKVAQAVGIAGVVAKAYSGRA